MANISTASEKKTRKSRLIVALAACAICATLSVWWFQIRDPFLKRVQIAQRVCESIVQATVDLDLNFDDGYTKNLVKYNVPSPPWVEAVKSISVSEHLPPNTKELIESLEVPIPVKMEVALWKDYSKLNYEKQAPYVACYIYDPYAESGRGFSFFSKCKSGFGVCHYHYDSIKKSWHYGPSQV